MGALPASACGWIFDQNVRRCTVEDPEVHHWTWVKRSRVLTSLLLLSGLAIAYAPQAVAQATGDSYRLGPGDVVEIRVFGEAELSVDARLNDSGAIDYPFLGVVDSNGLTPEELSQRITAGLKGPYLINPRVTVSISEYRPVFVDGEVASPGSFPYQPGLTLQQAITLAGGFTERAAQKRVVVIRKNDPTRTPTVIGPTDAINAGDVITVPQSFF